MPNGVDVEVHEAVWEIFGVIYQGGLKIFRAAEGIWIIVCWEYGK